MWDLKKNQLLQCFLKASQALSINLTARKSRELCRSIIGPGLTFIVMNLTKSCQEARLRARHGEKAGNGAKVNVLFKQLYDMYEPAGEEEEGARNITVTEEMSVDDVMKLVMDTISKI